jgi:hypothetical protein
MNQLLHLKIVSLVAVVIVVVVVVVVVVAVAVVVVAAVVVAAVVVLVGRDSSVGIAATHVLVGTESWRRCDFLHPSSPALGSTQPPIQWVPDHSQGKSGRAVALNNQPHLAPRLKKQ